MVKNKKPVKKSDKELSALIEDKIAVADYVILNHAKQRQIDRNISDWNVLNILANKPGYKRKRNKSKDKYEDGRADWNYCYEGQDIDKEKIRIIISFDEDYLLVITVIRLNDEK